MISIDSSVLRSMEYDEAKRELRLMFHTVDNVYVYEDVPPEIPTELFTAPSKGKYFAANIRNKFNFRRDDPTANQQ
jgi:lysyl-tRNA synthetase class 2